MEPHRSCCVSIVRYTIFIRYIFILSTKKLSTRMADDEEAGCKVEYLDTPDGTPEETNWIKRAGRAKVTYPNGCTFEGNECLY